MLNHPRKPLPSNIKPLVSAIATILALSITPVQANTYTVINSDDAGTGSLRWAIAQANANPGDDTIDFAPALEDETIFLTTGQIDISDATGSLLIDASAFYYYYAEVTISGSDSSRIFGETQGQKLTLNNVTITGGNTSLDSAGGTDCATSGTFTGGGAICAEGDLELIDSVISDSSTAGINASGGGFFAGGNATLIDSGVVFNYTLGATAKGGGFYAGGNATLTGYSGVVFNYTLGDTAKGGGFYAIGNATLTGSILYFTGTRGPNASGGSFFAGGNATLLDSAVVYSQTYGDTAMGGGFYAGGTATLTDSVLYFTGTEGLNASGGGFFAGGNATLTNSSVMYSRTYGNTAKGGGFFAGGDATLIRSTISEGYTKQDNADGGGFFAGGSATLTNSTVSGNRTEGSTARGGGLFVSGLATLNNSTITQNETLHATALGDGMFSGTTSLNSTILSGNGTDNLASGTANATNSLFGDPAGEINGGTNIDNVFNNSPGLASLLDNGCSNAYGGFFCTRTHSLLTSSPALDAGLPNGLTTDQRGTGFPRTIGSQTDIGAFEGTVAMPSFEKAFSPALITQGETSTLTFTITNSVNATLTGLNFTDNYPPGMINADPLVVGGSCFNRTYSAVAGGNSFDLTSGTIWISTTCTVTVDVTSTSVGTMVNTATDLGSTETGAGTDDAVATLTVTPPPPIPTIPVWGLGILAGLLGLMGFVRRRKS